jgi:hypothetical protein
MLLTLLSPTGAPPTTTVVWLRVGGVWKQTTVWLKVSGVWKTCTPFVKVSGTWK